MRRKTIDEGNRLTAMIDHLVGVISKDNFVVRTTGLCEFHTTDQFKKDVARIEKDTRKCLVVLANLEVKRLKKEFSDLKDTKGKKWYQEQ